MSRKAGGKEFETKSNEVSWYREVASAMAQRGVILMAQCGALLSPDRMGLVGWFRAERHDLRDL